MKIIVAADNNFAIGNKNNLLARLPADMKMFRETTNGNAIVVGRNTYLSFPSRPLPNRSNYVITPEENEFPEVKCFTSLESFLEFSKTADTEIYVSGGSMIYKLLLPYCEQALVTRINHEFEADAFFPNLDEMPEWEIINESEPVETNGFEIKFLTYRNNNVRQF